MHPRQIPFLRILLPWAAGIVAGAWLNRPVPGLGYALLAGVALLLVLAGRGYAYRFRWVFGAVLLVVLAGAGYFHAVCFDERLDARHFSHQPAAPVAFVGVVCDAPAKGGKLKAPLRLEAAGPAEDSLSPCSGTVLLFLDRTPAAERLQYGDRLWVRAAVRPTEPPKNPHAFDYQQYLRFQNIHYQAFVREESFRVIATGLGHPLWRVAFQWRDRLLAVLREHFPTTDEYAVAAALLVGYTDELSEDLRAAYAETGSMHALAVSGTHIGLLYAGLLFLLRRVPWPIRWRRWGETVLILSVIWAFTFITGATASVLRASLMFSAYLVGKAIRRQASVWNILGASAFGLLLFNPFMLFNAGFQLSYAAVAGMLAFYPPLQKRIPPLPRWATEGCNILLIGVAAQIGTLPLSLYYFHQFPVYFWLAGWVVVLGGAVFLWGGAVLALLHDMAPLPAAWLGKALYGLVWSMNALIQLIRHLPGSVVAGVWISAGVAVLLYAFIAAGGGALLWYRPRWLLTALSLLVVLACCRIGQAYGNIHQRQVVLYLSNRHFLLDFFDGESVTTLSDSLSARQEQFTAQAHRWACGMRRQVHLDSAAVFRDAHVLIRPPFVQFFNRKMVLVDAPSRVPGVGVAPVPVDVLFLRNNPNVLLNDCIRQFPCRLVVLDASNSRRRAERWKEECRSLGLPCRDVRNEGAWVATF